MKTKLLLLLISFVGALALTLNSCTKEPTASISSGDQLTASQAALAENMINDDVNFTNDTYVSAGTLKDKDAMEGPRHPFGPNANITITRKGDSAVKVIDFGPTNGLCNDGRIRRGKITITHFMRPMANDTSYVLTYENYGVNDNSVTGKTVVVYNGKNSEGQPSWTVTFTKTVTTKSGDVLTWTGTRTRLMTAGYNTPFDWTDDVFEITGNATFTNSKSGVTRTVTIVIPLVRKGSCNEFVSGSIKITRTNKSDMLIDFGNGVCDNIATLTIDGVITTIKI
jgi:hypothetical protein